MSFAGHQAAVSTSSHLPTSRSGRVIYLDSQATTPLDPLVLEAMTPYLTGSFANAASHHALGRQAASATDRAREQVATLIGGRASGLVFTSGATEANNLVLRGLAEGQPGRRKVVTVATEHPSVLEPAGWLSHHGWEVEILPVGPHGELDLDHVTAAVDDTTVLLSVMAANNEIGTLAPLAELAGIAHRRGALFHSDATQLVGKLPLAVDASGIDLLSMSAHKLYGPKGIGALYLNRAAARDLAPQILGGGHERGHRSGTLNVPGCVGFGAAADLAGRCMLEEAERLRGLGEQLYTALRQVGGVTLNGPPTPRLPGNINVCIEGTSGEDLMLRLPGIAVATGSACSSASSRPSHVLLAIGRSYDEADSALRLSAGRFTSEDDIDVAARELVRVIAEARAETTSALGALR